MGLTVLPPDVNASDFRCTGRGGAIRIGLQFVKGLSAEASGADARRQEMRKDGEDGRPARSRQPRPISGPHRPRPADLRALIKVGALDRSPAAGPGR